MTKEIIDVEYTVVQESEGLGDKTTEELAAEANTIWNQMEVIGNVGMLLAAQAGERLRVIKSRLAHGEWEEWCGKNLNFSLKKANRMMKLAEKMSDENSIFSKTTMLSDIGISKVWALLAVPEEVAEKAISNPNASEMSVREFQDEIRRLKEEKESMATWVKQAEERQRQAENVLQREIDALKEKLNEQETQEAYINPEQEAEKARLEAELENAKAKFEEEREKAEAELEREKEKAASAAEKAMEQARVEFEEKSRLLIDSNRQAAIEIDRLQKLQESSNEVAEFKVHADQLQMSFAKCMSCVRSVAAEQGEKMKAALKAVMRQLEEKI